MTDTFGGALALTVFTPIVKGREQELEEYLYNLPRGEQSPLARIDTLHISRIQVFRELVHQGPKQKHTDVLEHAQLVFTSTIDGALDPYLDALAERVPEADEWWGRCIGYPGRDDRAAFKAYVRSHRVKTGLFTSAIPNATVRQVHEALGLRERLIDFAVEAQGLDAATLQRRFRDAF
jgi:hypothetical protein